MNINGQKIDSRSFSKTLCFMFSGKAGVGKSTCADILLSIAKADSLKTAKISFASEVKRVAFEGFQWDGLKDERGRKLLQDIGRVGRTYNEDLWVESAMQAPEGSIHFPFEVVAIDDWRFENELRYIEKNQILYKPITIRVVSNTRTGLSGNTAFDESEVMLDNFDFQYKVSNNEPTTELLYKYIYDIYADAILKNLVK